MADPTSPPMDIEQRTFAFALRVIRLCRHIDDTPGVGRTLGKQLLRAGTSIGANVEEAHAAYSRAEFVVKITIGLKEARETRYGLRLFIESGLVPQALLEPLLTEATEIMKILGAIASKARRNSP